MTLPSSAPESAPVLKSLIAGRWIGTTGSTPLASAIDGSCVARTHAETIDFAEAVHHAHRAGVPLKTISHLVGHADVQTTERYLCTYYDDPAVITAPTPGAVAAFSAPTASVIPMRAKASR